MAAQVNIPQKPNPPLPVYDAADLLSNSEENALNQRLIAYADSTSTQIVIATIPSLNNEYEGILAPKWAHEWGIGNKDKDNGVFILIAQKERKIWIAPGYGLEHLLTAGRNGIIIRQHILPEFRNGNYYAGLQSGIDEMIALFSGEYEADTIEEGFPIGTIIIALFIFIIFLSIVMKSKGKEPYQGGNSFGGDLTDFIILSRMGRSGGYSGGFGGFGSSGRSFGGGFSGGFGGGGFSGGGAGGSW